LQRGNRSVSHPKRFQTRKGSRDQKVPKSMK
jgi:hypothetical protein